jgi:hypothetical protein
MSLSEQVQQRVRQLPERLQAEVLDFVEFLLAKHAEDERGWAGLSLALAMRGMADEDGPRYDLADVKETFS